jgi:predicted hydrocarbon binding protein
VILNFLDTIELGHQLEAIFYYLGHELGTILKARQLKEVSQIPNALREIIKEFNLGEMEIIDSSDEIINLRLRGHSSIKDLLNKGIKTEGSFCAFEAGMLAGIVEHLINIHCFAQEVDCGLQSGNDYCEFMIVFQKD